MELSQIVPYFPPPPEGVGAYALALATALRSRLGIDSRFVVGDPSWSGTAERNGCAVVKVPARERDHLADLLGDSTVLLHYANYGYQPRGCPSWLVEGVARWKERGHRRRLVTIFHEFYASGPPWRSAFWTSSTQRRLASSLARLSDGIVTSLDVYARMLRPWASGKEIAVLPVYSTVGEPAEVPPLAGRRPRMVVFGGKGARLRAYREALPELTAACRELDIEEVLDIGPQSGAPAEVGGATLRALGVLPAADISAALLGARAGFLAYPPAFLPKSTIFAAYCSHGVLPICASQREAGVEAPRKNSHYWSVDLRTAGKCETPVDLQGVATAAKAWYAAHSLARQAEVFGELLR